MSRAHAHQIRIDNFHLLRLRGVHATLANTPWFNPDSDLRYAWMEPHLVEAKRSVQQALAIAEAVQQIEVDHRTYLRSLWRPGAHPDCPISHDAVRRVHSTMRLGDVWAQVVRDRTAGGYFVRFSVDTPESGPYRRPPEAQVAGAGRIVRKFARDPRHTLRPGDRWAGDPESPHLIATLVRPSYVLLRDPSGAVLHSGRLPSWVRACYPKEYAEASKSVVWDVKFSQAPGTGSRVPGLPEHHPQIPHVTDLAGPLRHLSWCFTEFAGSVTEYDPHAGGGPAVVRVGLETLP